LIELQRRELARDLVVIRGEVLVEVVQAIRRRDREAAGIAQARIEEAALAMHLERGHQRVPVGNRSPRSGPGVLVEACEPERVRDQRGGGYVGAGDHPVGDLARMAGLVVPEFLIAEAVETECLAAIEYGLPGLLKGSLTKRLQLRRRGVGRIAVGSARSYAYDPRPALAAVRIPALALCGSRDLIAPPDLDVPALRKALARDRDATIVEIPGLNHFFQDAQTGSRQEFATIDETLAPQLLSAVSGWIAKHAR